MYIHFIAYNVGITNYYNLGPTQDAAIGRIYTGPDLSQIQGHF